MVISNIEKNARHKLYWYRPTKNNSPSSPYPMINVGRLMAQFISDSGKTKYLGLEAEAYFKDLVRDNAKEHSGMLGVEIHNIGILLENELSLNVVKILMGLSQEIVIILQWEYEVEHSKRFIWESSTPNVCLDFPENTIRRMEIENEV